MTTSNPDCDSVNGVEPVAAVDPSSGQQPMLANEISCGGRASRSDMWWKSRNIMFMFVRTRLMSGSCRLLTRGRCDCAGRWVAETALLNITY